jgi:predicted enzyme related to lactoylglutathione lyase
MPKSNAFSAECLTPILSVRDFREATEYYTKSLLFDLRGDWGDPPTFGCVALGKIEIFFCLRAQGAPGTWMSVFMDDVDGYRDAIKQSGADIIREPKDEPWGCREMHVRDPNQHVIRFSQGIPAREPKLPVERVPIELRLEKRLAALLKELAKHKDFSIGEVLEETLLHTFECVDSGGVASPHTRHTLGHIQDLKKKHGIDYDVHASYRFVEKPKRATKKKKK